MDTQQHITNKTGGGVANTGHDCRSRDIKRRLEVIQKKMADLQELGVPCGFCYVSIRNSSTLFTMGHPSITQPIEKSRDLILQLLSEATYKGGAHLTTNSRENLTSDDVGKEIHMLLPPLPAPLEELGLTDLRTMVVGIIKDLGLKWSDPKPFFWPENVPFQYPRNIPDGYQGCWTQGLRQVLQSIYTHFNPMTSLSSPPANNKPHPPVLFNNELPTVTAKVEEEEEEEEVDVGTPEDVVGVVIQPSQDMSDVESIAEEEQEEAETNNNNERHFNHPLSYFGYELAQSESSHASSPIASHTHDQDDATPTDTPLSYLTPNSKGLSLLQPHLVYCPPGLYSQLYPALSLPTATTTPLLLPLMKQLYVPPTRTSRDESPPLSSPNTHHPEESKEMLKGVVTRHSPPPPTHTNYRPHPPANAKCTERLPEPKNRKSKNGIYIYTNPTAPLQFMSLNTRTNRTQSHTTHATDTPTKSSTQHISNGISRKLVAGAPVSPHTGEPVAVRETFHTSLRQTATPPSDLEIDTSPAPKTPPPTRKIPGGGATLKKKRELVFHWYKSPEAPPTTKRPRLIDTHGNQSVV